MHLCVSIDQEINLDRNFRKLLKQNGNNIIKLIELDENSTEKQVSLHSIKSEITRREWKFISVLSKELENENEQTSHWMGRSDD